MDIIDENKYEEIKNILSGCRNINDAKYLVKLYLKHNSELKKLAYSLLYGKIYDDCNDYNTFYEIINRINDSDNNDYCTKMINEFYPYKNSNNIQMKTLNKFINKKKFSKIFESNSENFNFVNNHNPHIFNINQNKNKKIKQNEIIKNCPHCLIPYIGHDGLTHVICGYHNQHQGFDWKGCTKDWCFSCGKKLCKSWNENKLYLEINRFHDSECCKKYASNVFTD